MGATSSEILHLLKVKLPLQNDQRWHLLLTWFSKFSGGGPPTPSPPPQHTHTHAHTSRLENVKLIFQSSTAQHKAFSQK